MEKRKSNFWVSDEKVVEFPGLHIGTVEEFAVAWLCHRVVDRTGLDCLMGFW